MKNYIGIPQRSKEDQKGFGFDFDFELSAGL
jgi:hypothetical protein